MLDFSFSEVGLVGLVALVALGPERMPKVARGAGVLYGRFRRYALSVKADIDRELLQSELREVHRKIEEAKQEAARQTRSSVTAVDQFLAQPVTELSPAPQTAPDSLVLPTPLPVPEANEATSQESLAGSEVPVTVGTRDSGPKKVPELTFGGDPFTFRPSAPVRSRPMGARGEGA